MNWGTGTGFVYLPISVLEFTQELFFLLKYLPPRQTDEIPLQESVLYCDSGAAM